MDVDRGLGRVTREFVATTSEELSLRPNDLVQVVSRVDKFWLHVYHDGKEGSYPSGSITLLDTVDLAGHHECELFAGKEDFKAEQPGDLGFVRGSIIKRTGTEDGNWSRGQLIYDNSSRCLVIGNQVGIYPTTHAWQLRNDLIVSNSEAASSPMTETSASNGKPPIAVGTANTDLRAELTEEINLIAGAKVTIYGVHDRLYYKGECNGKFGIFPKSFVTISQVASTAHGTSSTNNSSASCSSPSPSLVPSLSLQGSPRPTRQPQVTNNGGEDDPPSYETALHCPSVSSQSSSSLSSSQASVRNASTDATSRLLASNDNVQDGVASYAMTLHPFKGEFSNELTFDPGQIVHLLRHIDHEWLEGELNGSIGIFPKNYVRIVVDVHDHQEVGSLDGIERQESVSEEFHYPADTYARVLYAFSGEVEGDLPLQEGSTITLLRKLSEDWVEATDDAGTIGVCPFAFVEIISETADSNHEAIYQNTLDMAVDERYGDSFNTSNMSLMDGSPIMTALLKPSGESGTSIDFQPQRTSSKRPSFESSTERDGNLNLSANASAASGFSLRNITASRTQAPLRPAPPSPAALGGGQNPIKVTPKLEPIHARQASQEETESLEREARRKDKQKEQKSCILMELLQSERDYIRDLKVCYTQFEKPIHSWPDLRGVIGNLSEVIAVSEKLLYRLERSVADDGRGLGSCFISSADSMRSAYSIFCRNSDDVPIRWERLMSDSSEPQVRRVLENALEKIKAETNCFDIPSLLIKPVQRILKYPLLLSELVKCEEDNSTARSELTMAIQTMTEMAAAINESKRRKDLVFKYRKVDDSSSFTEKFAKLNMHTMRKKSSRLGLKLSSTFGLSSMTKDEQFDQMCAKFKSLEKTLKIFLKDLNAFLEQREDFVKMSSNFIDTVGEYYGERSGQQEVEQLKIVHAVILDEYWRDFKKQVATNVNEILNMLLTKFNSVNHLIDKRADKLLDFDAASKRAASERDPIKAKGAKEEHTASKNNYEALNKQLTDDLPKLIEFGTRLFLNCLSAFLKIKKLFIGKTANQIITLLDLPLLLSSSYAGSIHVGDIQGKWLTNERFNC